MAPDSPVPAGPSPTSPPSGSGGGALASIGTYVGRSLLPLITLAILAGTLLWGPWVSLVLAYAAWRLAGIYA